MNIRNLLSKLVAQVCEKNYAVANVLLDTIVTEKVKDRIKKTSEKLSPTEKKNEKKTAKPEKKTAKPEKKTAKPKTKKGKAKGFDFTTLKKGSKKVESKGK